MTRSPRRPASRTFRLATIVFLVALVPRLWLALTFSHDDLLAKPGADAVGYEILARNLLAAHGFTLDTEPPYRPDSIRTPLYPALIAAVYAVTGPSPRDVVFLQVVLDALTAVLVLLSARRLLSPSAGLAAGLVYALTPTQWRFAATLLTEAPLAFLIAAALACLVWVRRPWRLGLSLGVLGALAVLCKPNVTPLPLVWAVAAAGVSLPLAAAADRPALRAALPAALRTAGLTVLVSGVLLAPWVLRNTVVFGRPILSTAFEDNIAHVTAVATLASAEGQAIPLWSPPWEERYGSILARAEVRYGFSFAGERQWSPHETDVHWRQVGVVAQEIVLAHPRDAVKTQLAGAAQVWWGPVVRDWTTWWPYEYQGWYAQFTGRHWPPFEPSVRQMKVDVAHTAASVGRPAAARHFVEWFWTTLDWGAAAFWLAWQTLFFAGALCALAGVIALRRQPVFLLTMLTVVVYLTVLPGPIGYERFRVPCVPFVAILQGAGLVAIAAAVVRTSPRPSPLAPDPIRSALASTNREAV